jgi:signal transduction histidine kinase
VRGGEGALIRADRPVLATALMNVVQNALKFSRTGATVTVRVGATADRVIIDIEDECGGIAGGDVDKLFEPFHQQNDNRSGVGLGLTFAQKAVESSGGVITARNIPHVGCVFSVDLPRVQVPAGPASTAPGPIARSR